MVKAILHCKDEKKETIVLIQVTAERVNVSDLFIHSLLSECVNLH